MMESVLSMSRRTLSAAASALASDSTTEMTATTDMSPPSYWSSLPDEDEDDIIYMTQRVTGAVGIVCGVVMAYMAYSRRRHVYHCLHLGISVHCIIFSVSNLVSANAIPADTLHAQGHATGTTQTCSVQGFFTQFSSFGISFYYVFLSFYSYVAVTQNFVHGRYRWVDKWWTHLFIHLFPVVSSFYLLAIEAFNYTGTGCWVASIPFGCGDDSGIPCERGPQNIGRVVWIWAGIPTFFVLLVPLVVMVSLYVQVRRKQETIRIRASKVASQAALYLLALYWSYIFAMIRKGLEVFNDEIPFWVAVISAINVQLQPLWFLLIYRHFTIKSRRRGGQQRHPAEKSSSSFRLFNKSSSSDRQSDDRMMALQTISNNRRRGSVMSRTSSTKDSIRRITASTELNVSTQQFAVSSLNLAEFEDPDDSHSDVDDEDDEEEEKQQEQQRQHHDDENLPAEHHHEACGAPPTPQMEDGSDDTDHDIINVDSQELPTTTQHDPTEESTTGVSSSERYCNPSSNDVDGTDVMPSGTSDDVDVPDIDEHDASKSEGNNLQNGSNVAVGTPAPSPNNGSRLVSHFLNPWLIIGGRKSGLPGRRPNAGSLRTDDTAHCDSFSRDSEPPSTHRGRFHNHLRRNRMRNGESPNNNNGDEEPSKDFHELTNRTRKNGQQQEPRLHQEGERKLQATTAASFNIFDGSNASGAFAQFVFGNDDIDEDDIESNDRHQSEYWSAIQEHV